MKIFGHIITELNDKYLIKYYNLCLILFPCYLFFGALFTLGFIGMIYELVSGEFPKEMSIVIFMSLGGAVSMIIVAANLLKKIKPIKAEIRTRKIPNEVLKAILKKMLFYCTILVIVIIMIPIFVFNRKPSQKCIECGRNPIYSKYGFCYSCYKEVYDSIEENSKDVVYKKTLFPFFAN